MKSDAQLLNEIEALGPWHHKVKLRGDIHTQSSVKTDGTGQKITNYDPFRAFDLATKDVFPEGLKGRSFLDCACNAGGYSFAAKDRGAGEVFGFDIRQKWIEQALFIVNNREADNSGMRFEVSGFDDLARSDKSYDITWFSGIFYHLPDPIASLKIAADHTQEVLFLNSACTWLNEGEVETLELVFRPEGTEQLLSGVEGMSWLPSGPQVLKKILKWMGFAEVKTYFWIQDSNNTDQKRRFKLARVAVAAARSAGVLDAMVDLSSPVSHRELAPHKPTTAAKPIPAKPVIPLSGRQNQGRPLRWEDDISRNARDTEPFALVSPVAEWEPEAFEAFHSGQGPVEIADLPVLSLAKRDTAPLPVKQDREGYCGDNHEWYWLSGLRDYHTACQIVRRHKGHMDRVLDVGCASGRVLRHFAFQSNATEIWGSEINHRHIRFLCDHMPPNVRPVAVPCLPNYPVEDNYFDLVTAFSVFTHIDVFETAFVAEIRRILKPGGLACLTVLDDSTWTSLRESATDSARKLAKQIATHSPEFQQNVHGSLTHTNRYYSRTEVGPYRGVIFTPQEQLASIWGRFFKIEETIPFGHAQQTILVLRK